MSQLLLRIGKHFRKTLDNIQPDWRGSAIAQYVEIYLAHQSSGAERALETIGPPAIPALIEAITSGHPQAFNATIMLRQIEVAWHNSEPAKLAIGELLKELDSEDADTRESAQKALRLIPK